MIIKFDPTGTVEGLKKLLTYFGEQENISGLLILSGAGNNYTKKSLDPVLTGTTLPIIGGLFPGIIHENKMHEKGNLVIGLPKILSTQTIPGLSDNGVDYEILLEQNHVDQDKVNTLFVFVDGFATRTSTFIESLFNVYGLDFNYIGGGAGSLTMERAPYLFTNKGMLEDCAVLAFLENESGVAVCHGWQELLGPYQVTASSKNVIHSIEWQPAFNFYSNLLLKQTGKQVEPTSFYTIAQSYPFGIARLDGEHIVRDPYQVGPDNSLSCFGEIPEGAFLSILTAENVHLIDAAGKSLQLGLEAFPADKEASLHFFVDCISRTIVLTDDYQKELDAVYSPGTPLAGVCSIGEIANSGTEYLELYNKTSVMAVLE